MNFRTIRLALKVAPTVLHAELFWLHRWARHPERVPLEKRYNKVRKLTRRIIDLLEIDVKFKNSSLINSQKKCYLGLSNHRHFIDPLFYIYYSEKPISFVSKIENAKKPFVKDVMACIDCLYIDREDVINQVRVFKKMSERIKNNELSYFIFPEGTRMKNRNQINTLHYKDGSIKPAYWAECDIIPCATYGSDFMLIKKNPKLKKRNITIEAIKIIKHEVFSSMTTIALMPLIEKDSNSALEKLYKENLSRNLRR